jgi:hypothetical protein
MVKTKAVPLFVDWLVSFCNFVGMGLIAILE